jgi:four helix bundle protein
MAIVLRFEELEIWQQARDICKKIRKITEASISFSKDFSLKSQILRSSGSVMDNIAEGFERNGKKEFINFLYIAKGSLGEVRSQIHRSFDAEHIEKTEYDAFIEECYNLSGKIAHFISYLSRSEFKGTKMK